MLQMIRLLLNARADKGVLSGNLKGHMQGTLFILHGTKERPPPVRSSALRKALETTSEQGPLPLSSEGRVWQLPLGNVTCLPGQVLWLVGSVPPPPLLVSR